jgi:hypothetical protein
MLNMGEKEPVIMTKAKVRVMYFGMFMTFATAFIYPFLKQKYPELLETDKEHEMIHNEAEKIALNFPTLMSEKHNKESKEWDRKIRVERNLRIKLENKLNLLSEDLRNYKLLIDDLKKHTEFNTNALTITSSALLEEMDKKENSCGWAYYETNGGDNWAMFDCKYSSQILYSVDLRSDCRAYYTPIGGAKTKIKL